MSRFIYYVEKVCHFQGQYSHLHQYDIHMDTVPESGWDDRASGLRVQISQLTTRRFLSKSVRKNIGHSYEPQPAITLQALLSTVELKANTVFHNHYLATQSNKSRCKVKEKINYTDSCPTKSGLLLVIKATKLGKQI